MDMMSLSPRYQLPFDSVVVFLKRETGSLLPCSECLQHVSVIQKGLSWQIGFKASSNECPRLIHMGGANRNRPLVGSGVCLHENHSDFWFAPAPCDSWPDIIA